MNAQASIIIADTTATSATAYARACDELFSLWARLVRRQETRELARTVRSMLSCLHATWAGQQACPPHVAERFCTLASKACHTR